MESPDYANKNKEQQNKKRGRQTNKPKTDADLTNKSEKLHRSISLFFLLNKAFEIA